MLKSYLKLAARNFLKFKTYSSINLIGLAIGLACVLLILSFVRYELSFDASYSNSKRTYRLVEQINDGTKEEETVYVHSGLAKAMQSEFPEIEAVTYPKKTKFEFIHNGEVFQLDALHADSSYFKVFNLPFAHGNPNTAPQPHQIIISEKVASTYFPNKNAVGNKLISEEQYGTKTERMITGVIKDIPKSTHFSADIILFSNLETEDLNWQQFHNTLPQYVLLKENTDISQLEKKMATFYQKYGFPKEITIRFQSVPSIHLYSKIANEPFVNSDIKQVYIFSIAAALILFIGCINYVNLTTARSLQRVQEVGVRKVLGADRKQLIFQFIGESFFFFCLALPLAFFLAYLFWPHFARIMDIEATTNEMFSLQNLLLIALISVVSGFLSGAYPALFLSRLKPTSLLKEHYKGFKLNVGLRKVLIVLQFVISVSLIIATVVVYRQLHYFNTKPLGFNKNHLLVLPHGSYDKQWAAFKNELKAHNNIENVTLASWNVGETYGYGSSIIDPKNSTKQLYFDFIDADVDFTKTMEIQLLQGRELRSGDASFSLKIDSFFTSQKNAPEEGANLLASQSILISDKTAAVLGLDDPIGTVLRTLPGTVVGLVADFQGLSLRQQNTPLVIRAFPPEKIKSGSVYIRVGAVGISETIDYIRSKWKNFFPSKKFDFAFVDERLQELYDAENRLASLFMVFALLAICLACFGLYSLVALIVQQRTKEVGIRKILGAGVGEIVGLLSSDFIKLILIGICIAVPAAWWLMNKWLQDFAYRIQIGWWIFALAGFVALLIAMIAISAQAIKAALANPVRSLRSD